MNNKMSNNKPATAVWLAEGQSSQRDMLESLQLLKAHSTTPFTIIGSHRHQRPEIFEFADIIYLEPYKSALVNEASTDEELMEQTLPERWQFVLEQAEQNDVKVLLTGRNGIDYEAHRAAFTEAGIRLLTGATSVAALDYR